jgi:hypothetical protein
MKHAPVAVIGVTFSLFTDYLNPWELCSILGWA